MKKNKMPLHLILVLSLAAFGFTACTWPTTLVKTDQVHPPVGAGRGWLVMPSHVISDHIVYNKKSCSLIVTPGFNKYDVKFEMLDKESSKEPAKFSMVELPVGTYDIMEIYCGHASGNLQFAGFARFNVFADKISVLAGLHVHINQDLVMTTFRYSSVTEQTREVEELLKQFKPEEQKRVVSAYTEQPLADKLQAKMSVPAAMLKSPSFVKQIDQCYSQEMKANPLLIGALRIDWTSSDASSLQVGGGPSLFTQDMKACLRNSVADFLKTSHASIGSAWL